MQIALELVNELVNIETVHLNGLIDKLTVGDYKVKEILEVEIDDKKTVSLNILATVNHS
jgi:hypothetical protein